MAVLGERIITEGPGKPVSGTERVIAFSAVGAIGFAMKSALEGRFARTAIVGSVGVGAYVYSAEIAGGVKALKKAAHAMSEKLKVAAREVRTSPSEWN